MISENAQNEADAQSIRTDGFTDVRVLIATTEFNGTRLTRIEGQHYSDDMTPELKKFLGATSGIVFQHADHDTVYVSGETIWSQRVEDAIKNYRPEVIVLNAAYARLEGYDNSSSWGKRICSVPTGSRRTRGSSVSIWIRSIMQPRLG